MRESRVDIKYNYNYRSLAAQPLWALNIHGKEDWPSREGKVKCAPQGLSEARWEGEGGTPPRTVWECGRGCRDLRLWIFDARVPKTEIRMLSLPGTNEQSRKDVGWLQQRSWTLYACPLQHKNDYTELFSRSLL